MPLGKPMVLLNCACIAGGSAVTALKTFVVITLLIYSKESNAQNTELALKQAKYNKPTCNNIFFDKQTTIVNKSTKNIFKRKIKITKILEP
jgi:hypothetical protein